MTKKKTGMLKIKWAFKFGEWKKVPHFCNCEYCAFDGLRKKPSIKNDPIGILIERIQIHSHNVYELKKIDDHINILIHSFAQKVLLDVLKEIMSK